MTIYDNKGFSPINEYRLEEVTTHVKEKKQLLAQTRTVLRIYVEGVKTDTIIEIEPEKGLPFYNKLRMSPEDRGRLRTIIEAQH